MGQTVDRSASEAGIGTLLGGDGFRGIAMTLIFVTHVALIADPGEGLADYGFGKEIIGRFDLGLAVFFALSGYLISRPFVRSYLLGLRRPSVRRFARNRVLRIVPAFYVIAGLVLLRFGMDGTIGATPPDLGALGTPSETYQAISIFTFTQIYTQGSVSVPIGHAWSLDAEVGFYLSIPFVALVAYWIGGRLATPKRRAQVALAGISLAALISIWLRQKGTETTLASPPLILFTFLPGVAMAVMEPFLVSHFRGHAQRARRFAWGMVGLALISYALYAAWDYNVATTQIHHSLGRRALLAALFSLFILGAMIALQLGTERAPRWLDNRVSNFLGVRSYAFYLLHIWVLLEIVNLAGRDTSTGMLWVLMLGIGLPVTIAGAALSWALVERPFLQRRLPWAPTPRSRPPTPPPAPPGEADPRRVTAPAV